MTAPTPPWPPHINSPGFVVGIDVSRWQDPDVLPWAELAAAGVYYAFIKASQSDWSDGARKKHHAEARAAKVPVGFYHYMKAAYSARDQADAFLRATSKLSAQLPPVLDFEEKDIPASLALEWGRIVQEATGIRPILYASKQALDARSPAEQRQLAEAFDYWSVDYYKDGVIPGPCTTADLDGAFESWDFWQWTSNNTLLRHIYPKDLDHNFYNGSVEELYSRYGAGEDNPPAPGKLLTSGQAGEAVDYNARQTWTAAFWGSMIAFLGVSPWRNEGIAQAVARYQLGETLDVDGKVGPRTHASLKDAMGLA